MIRKGFLSLLALLSLLSVTGCWNLKEPDEQAFVMGTGLDLSPDGRIDVSLLIAIPAGIGGQDQGASKKSFRVLSATGKSIYDAIHNLQNQLSRSLFIGHREIVLIGERMAEHGLTSYVDEFFRNPQSEIRSNLFVVKGATAKEMLNLGSMFDPFITTTLLDEQKTLGLKRYVFVEFISEVLGQGLQPLVPVIRIKDSRQFEYAGLAILNKDDIKLAGYLNANEANYENWILGRQDDLIVTIEDKRGGTLSVKLRGLRRRIRTIVESGKVKAQIALSGNGFIVENTTEWEPTVPKDLVAIQNELNEQTKQGVLILASKAQTQYKLDILGIGDQVHKQHPVTWKALKPRWNELFPQTDITATVRIECKDPGQTASTMISR